MGRIAILSEDLINKIAAGEVVERPASVVKELAENSLDGGASNIRVELEEGGLALVRVTDDGVGMSRDDAALCVLRHATSKIRDLDGLTAILTKGFRGEALSAIASVSRLTLVTSERGSMIGTKVRVEGTGHAAVEDAPPAPGTSVSAEDLFFNTPARRKFMRRPPTELAHSHDALIRLALAHPEVGFFLKHEGRQVLSSPAASDPPDRIAAAIGQEVISHLLAVEEHRLGVSVHGYVASPEFCRPNARGIFTFVNRRYIRDRGFNHAIAQAFRDTLPAGRQPVAILFIEVDPRSVDVNVHPQKLEVRFGAPRIIYDAVVGGIRRALAGALKLGAPSPLEASEPLVGARYALAVKDFLAKAHDGTLQPLPLPMVREASFSHAWRGPESFGKRPEGFFASLRYLGTLGGRFLVCEGSGGTLVAIDPHAALERVRLGELRQGSGEKRKQVTQGSLFAATVELTQEEAAAILEQQPVLARLGVEIEHFGGRSFAIKSIPAPLMGVDFKKLFKELAALKSEGSAWEVKALQVFACHAASQWDRSFTQEEIHSLFKGLDESDFSPQARHSQVVVLEIPFLEIARKLQ